MAEGWTASVTSACSAKLSWSGWTVQAAWVERGRAYRRTLRIPAFSTPFPDARRERLPRRAPRDRPRSAAVFLVQSDVRALRLLEPARIRRDEDGEYDDGEVRRARLPRRVVALRPEVRRALVRRPRWYSGRSCATTTASPSTAASSRPPARVTDRDDGELSRRTFSLYVADDYRLNQRWTAQPGRASRRRRRSRRQPQPACGVDLAAGSGDHLEGFVQRGLQDAQRQRRWTSDDTAVPEYVAATELVLQRQLAPHTRFTGSCTATGAATCRSRTRTATRFPEAAAARAASRPRSSMWGARRACAPAWPGSARAMCYRARRGQLARPARQARLHLPAAGRGAARRPRDAISRPAPRPASAACSAGSRFQSDRVHRARLARPVGLAERRNLFDVTTRPCRASTGGQGRGAGRPAHGRAQRMAAGPGTRSERTQPVFCLRWRPRRACSRRRCPNSSSRPPACNFARAHAVARHARATFNFCVYGDDGRGRGDAPAAGQVLHGRRVTVARLGALSAIRDCDLLLRRRDEAPAWRIVEPCSAMPRC